MHGTTPRLDPIELTATVDGRTEHLSEQEYLLLEQLIRFRDQSLTRTSLEGVLDADAFAVPDRIVDQVMTRLMHKTNALQPRFPLLRRLGRDRWIYSESAPPTPVRSR